MLIQSPIATPEGDPNPTRAADENQPPAPAQDEAKRRPYVVTWEDSAPPDWEANGIGVST